MSENVIGALPSVLSIHGQEKAFTDWLKEVADETIARDKAIAEIVSDNLILLLIHNPDKSGSIKTDCKALKDAAKAKHQ